MSYIRNSVKATVDAYDGTVTLYQIDENDPVLTAWMGVFPGTVQPPDDDSRRTACALPLPRGPVPAAARDAREVPRGRSAGVLHQQRVLVGAERSRPPTRSANQPPYYVLVGDPETAEPSFRLTSAMVGFNREFLSAYLSVHSDPDNYGKIDILQLPTDTQTQGPQQTQNSMISDTRVASERTLLERSNRIHYGNLLTLPIADGGILYVEPLFTERLTAPPNGRRSRSWPGCWSATANPAPAGCGSATPPPSPRPSTRCSAPAPAPSPPHPAATRTTPPPRRHRPRRLLRNDVTKALAEVNSAKWRH